MSSSCGVEDYNRRLDAMEIVLVISRPVWILMKAKSPLFRRALIDWKSYMTVQIYLV